MTKLENRQAFICILVGFLLCGLTCYGLLTTIVEPNQDKPLSFDSFKESPLRNSESYPTSSPLWQVNQSNIAFLQNVTEISSNKVLTKSPGNVRSALCYCYHDTDSSHAEISPRIIDTPNTIFRFLNRQNCQHLDIPPPHASLL